MAAKRTAAKAKRGASKQEFCKHRVVTESMVTGAIIWEGSAFQPVGRSKTVYKCIICGTVEDRAGQRVPVEHHSAEVRRECRVFIDDQAVYVGQAALFGEA